MKTIKTLVEIPAKYKHKAKDEHGSWYAYTTEPEPTTGMFTGYGAWRTGGEYMKIGAGNPDPNWKQTLQRIHEYEDVSDE